MEMIIPADKRGTSRISWLDSKHTFSFANHYDPHAMGYGPLRDINHDVIAPASGFDMHFHRDMEILTVILRGSLAHTDSMGHRQTIGPGEVQHFSAGSGIMHAEVNPSTDSETELLQIWIKPRARGISPSYDQRKFAFIENGFTLVASETGENESLHIQQNARVYMARYADATDDVLPVSSGSHVWIHVISGAITIEEKTLTPGDGAGFVAKDGNTFHANPSSSFILFDMP
jgi:redox-sensitive bicupin YhaK (pirin superfamily)